MPTKVWNRVFLNNKRVRSSYFLTPIFLAVSLVVFGLLFGLTQTVGAVKSYADAPKELSAVVGKTGITETSVEAIVANVIANALLLVGLLFFILMVYGGIKWMQARGREDEVTKARDTIIAAVIGLFISIAAYAITEFVANQIIRGERANELVFESPDTLGSEALVCCIAPIGQNEFGVVTGFYYLMTTQNDCVAKSLGNTLNEGYMIVPQSNAAECAAVFACVNPIGDSLTDEDGKACINNVLKGKLSL